MTSKEYIRPTVKIVAIAAHHQILAASDGYKVNEYENKETITVGDEEE